MDLAFVLALCAALFYLAKFADDYYVSDTNKRSIAARVNRLYEYLRRHSIPDIARLLADWFFLATDLSIVIIVYVIMTLFDTTLILVYTARTHYTFWYVVVIVTGLLFPLTNLGICVIYFTIRYLYILLRNHRRSFARALAVPICILLSFLVFSFIGYSETSLYMQWSRFNAKFLLTPIGTFLFITWVGAFTFGLIGLFILFVFVIRSIIVIIDIIFLHILHMASSSNRPFGYTISILFVLYGIFKAIIELGKHWI